jgi:hypothetical protein
MVHLTKPLEQAAMAIAQGVLGNANADGASLPRVARVCFLAGRLDLSATTVDELLAMEEAVADGHTSDGGLLETDVDGTRIEEQAWLRTDDDSMAHERKQSNKAGGTHRRSTVFPKDTMLVPADRRPTGAKERVAKATEFAAAELPHCCCSWFCVL